MSDGLVDDIGNILRTAPPKTIVKVRRIWVIDGVPRYRGYIYPDVMPRLHHRGSGATLRTGKTVHEKYEYDATFTEVVAEHPLFVPIDPLDSLIAKDRRYITLEVEHLRAHGYTWPLYVRWFLLREPLIILNLLVRMLFLFPLTMRRDAVPFAHNFRYVRYHARLLRAVTGFMFERTFRRRA
jgi:hypothetical protein